VFTFPVTPAVRYGVGILYPAMSFTESAGRYPVCDGVLAGLGINTAYAINFTPDCLPILLCV